jgi:hypothetical protein
MPLPSPLRAGRIEVVSPAGQAKLGALRSMSNQSLGNIPPAALGVWVMHRETIPASPSR